ncbi:RagB/SusD family nutrient uptake outer membrane protein [Sphingobacterium sp. InxBP1]|uniref:RagB/SusD family nutrient uptake outer membrane protein n=1 Tax=Sphingobacterium sp. InxBP1 TaxID=2870328 RepID=UPI0022432B10|nr:RagB/SusD family nutrient uptake outer membrane protein [Sphingobacterium sp. InxBP1]MCW8310843.1 RagB/SusD family nutrient uptake outer membrane protein [Sphingobacterium sp. InxBP1]
MQCTISCGKYLEEKADYSISVAETLNDLRALLDNEGDLNRNLPGLLETGTDDYYVTDAQYGAVPPYLQGVYIWSADVNATDLASWSTPYKAIMMANVVLNALERIPNTNPQLYQELYGEAHFIRGYQLFLLAQIFCQPFNSLTAKQELGLPLKYEADLAEEIQRSSLTDTYQQIIDDLKKAADNLDNRSKFISRPCKAAAYMALARTYLAMGDYRSAESFTDKALDITGNLLDYKTVATESTQPFNTKNPELIYYVETGQSYQLIYPDYSFISNDLYAMYDALDLRRALFFSVSSSDKVTFKGYYANSSVCYFGGFATPELYLTKAECLARRSEKDEAVYYLDQLLSHRWKDKSYRIQLENNKENLLAFILDERRKEMLMRGVRWMDIRRLNALDNKGIALKRELLVNGVVKSIVLPANDPRFCFPIPQEVILQSRIPQNAR